jgi:hypothetical protein
MPAKEKKMKKKVFRFALLAILGINTASHAELFNRGAGLIYDSANNITWLAMPTIHGRVMPP